MNQRGLTPILILVGILLIALTVGAAYYLGTKSTATVIPLPTPQDIPSPQPDDTASWKTYVSQEGEYSFKYPLDVKIYENEKFSVDGTKVSIKDTVVVLSEVLPQLNTNYQMSINHKVTFIPSLKDFVDSNISCASMESIKGKPYLLGNKEALIFEDTPCGPYGMTSIYSLNKSIGYTIDIESHAGYSQIKKYIEPILSTFEFTNETSPTSDFCGGIAGITCSSGYSCKLDGTYPDAGGKCVKN